MIRVLIIDDSATMRALIAATLRRDPQITVIGQACNPQEARAAIKALNPDVITLDVDMPGMNGLDFLEKLMRLRPMPVVMISTLTARGAETTLKALALGAVECVEKPQRGEGFENLSEAIHTAAAARVRAAGEGGPRAAPAPFLGEGTVVGIGSSTGGVEALTAVLSAFPANCPPTLITQHIRPAFTRSLAERLDRHCAASVREATDGAPLQQGCVYLAPGGELHLAIGGSGPWRCSLQHGPAVNGHCPSVDVLFASLARHAGPHAVGAILTGMGRDGARGLLAIRERGGRTLGQDQESCVVYGMPRAAFEIGAVETQVPLNSMATRILRAASSLSIGVS
ncbi:MAG: chemotaxis response regulator protein-glutamate methylesterase [Acetobacteraceae bacterium]|nr:chemotaxis response regulator protein-glutamate methylesterase [Acetobacteraceae bacterium]